MYRYQKRHVNGQKLYCDSVRSPVLLSVLSVTIRHAIGHALGCKGSRQPGYNKFNRDSGTSSQCQRVTVNATTDTTPTIIPFQAEDKEKKPEDDRCGFEFNIIYIIIIITVSGLAGIMTL
ncbi:hypothetical protein ElyMa_001066600 [Elysia marginata]|uniref:Peptidase M12B domain-containing protein n=1 Tax=Elysia marginata TaxID=1093978 RepID=A0AAV4HT82_9GAST|nr:hypothetical protein ElyMa_001066600 [Elysia marginata]